jgi:hypothetical protein
MHFVGANINVDVALDELPYERNGLKCEKERGT